MGALCNLVNINSLQFIHKRLLRFSIKLEEYTSVKHLDKCFIISNIFSNF